MKYPNIRLIAGDKEMTFKGMVMGGICADNENETMGFYGGPRDIGEFGVCTMQALRGVVKFSREEFGLSMQESIDFVAHCLEEAVNREVKGAGKSETFRQVFRG
jgi:hypothetical protein